MVRTTVIAGNTVTKQVRSVRLACGLLAALCVPATGSAADLPVYDATQVAYGSYTIVRRIWVDDWRSAFWVGGQRDVEAAKQAVIDRAARAGADGVVNLTCMNQTDRMFSRAGHYCYGDAIRRR